MPYSELGTGNMTDTNVISARTDPIPDRPCDEEVVLT